MRERILTTVERAKRCLADKATSATNRTARGLLRELVAALEEEYGLGSIQRHGAGIRPDLKRAREQYENSMGGSLALDVIDYAHRLEHEYDELRRSLAMLAPKEAKE